MSNKTAILYLFISIIVMISACTKTTETPAFPPEPKINLVEISHDTLVEFQDQLVLTIAYEDGDGDLGTSDPDVNSIFIKDERLAVADEYYLPPLAPEDANISITGEVNIELSTTFLLGNGTQEMTTFELYMVDRAGNKSNVIATPEILIIE